MEKDRRIRRTRAAIQSAFLKLTFEKNINRITVKELCEQADINKSTFYLHYQDIYDLTEQFKQDVSTKVCDIILEYEMKELISKAPEIWKRILNLKLDEGILLSSLKDTSLKQLTEDIGSCAMAAIMEKLSASVQKKDKESLYQYHIFITFIISGFLGVLRSFDKEELTKRKAFEKLSQGLEYGMTLL